MLTDITLKKRTTVLSIILPSIFVVDVALVFNTVALLAGFTPWSSAFLIAITTVKY